MQQPSRAAAAGNASSSSSSSSFHDSFRRVTIGSLVVGDRVVSGITAKGDPVCDTVYFTGQHGAPVNKEATAAAIRVVRLVVAAAETKAETEIRVTSTHLIHIQRHGATSTVAADKVHTGDEIKFILPPSGGGSPAWQQMQGTVKGRSLEETSVVYEVLTMRGDIVVDGLHVSSHADSVVIGVLETIDWWLGMHFAPRLTARLFSFPFVRAYERVVGEWVSVENNAALADQSFVAAVAFSLLPLMIEIGLIAALCWGAMRATKRVTGGAKKRPSCQTRRYSFFSALVVILIAACVILPTADGSPAVRPMPGLHRLSFGYDVAGASTPPSAVYLFDVNASTSTRTPITPFHPEAVYDVPASVVYAAGEEQTMLNFSQTSLTINEFYTQQMTTHSHHGWFHSSSTTTYDFAHHALIHNQSQSIQARFVSLYTLEVDPLPPPRMNPAFVAAVKMLPDGRGNGDEAVAGAAYESFFGEFGTDVLSSVSMGGRLQYQVWYDSCLEDTFGEDWVTHQKSSSFFGFFSHTKGHHSDKGSRNATWDTSSEQDAALEGGDTLKYEPYTYGDLDAWVDTIYESPVPLSFKSRSIASAVADVDPSTAKFEALEAARTTYLAAHFNKTVNAVNSLMPKNPAPPPSWCKPKKPNGTAFAVNAVNAVEGRAGVAQCGWPCKKDADCASPYNPPCPTCGAGGHCTSSPSPAPSSLRPSPAGPAAVVAVDALTSRPCGGTLIPGLDEGVGLSFNTLKGTPVSKFPVFGYTCDEAQIWREPINGTVYTVPDQLSVHSDPSAHFMMSSKVSFTAHQHWHGTLIILISRAPTPLLCPTCALDVLGPSRIRSLAPLSRPLLRSTRSLIPPLHSRRSSYRSRLSRAPRLTGPASPSAFPASSGSATPRRPTSPRASSKSTTARSTSRSASSRSSPCR